jgi:Zn-dependent peptidase ImmA (M78 family)
MKALAREVRGTYSLAGAQVGLRDLRRIYSSEGIRIDLWRYKLKNLRGAYFGDEHGPSVMISKSLPNDPRAFTMAHELKHHFADRDLALSFCDPSNQHSMIEIGAEVFAAELLFPEREFQDRLSNMGVQRCTCRPEHLVRLKRETGTSLSYAGLAKRAVFLYLARPEAMTGIRWKTLEEQIYGVPHYRRRRRR